MRLNQTKGLSLTVGNQGMRIPCSYARCKANKIRKKEIEFFLLFKPTLIMTFTLLWYLPLSPQKSIMEVTSLYLFIVGNFNSKVLLTLYQIKLKSFFGIPSQTSHSLPQEYAISYLAPSFPCHLSYLLSVLSKLPRMDQIVLLFSSVSKAFRELLSDGLTSPQLDGPDRLNG